MDSPNTYQGTRTHEMLNSLLRAELSALETYQHVLQKTEAKDAGTPVRQICEDHRESAQLLSAQIAELGGQPDNVATTWKNIDVLASGLSQHPLQDPIAIKALIEGERQDEISYEGALDGNALEGETREMVERMLLPRTRSHISTLEKLLCDA